MQGLKTYHNVWVANEAVDWLCQQYPLTRESSVQLMRELQKGGYFEYRKAKRQVLFEDEHSLFRWRDPTVVPVAVQVVVVAMMVVVGYWWLVVGCLLLVVGGGWWFVVGFGCWLLVVGGACGW